MTTWYLVKIMRQPHHQLFELDSAIYQAHKSMTFMSEKKRTTFFSRRQMPGSTPDYTRYAQFKKGNHPALATIDIAQCSQAEIKEILYHFDDPRAVKALHVARMSL